MTIDQAIIELSENPKFDLACKFYGGHLKDDLKQEVLVKLLESKHLIENAVNNNYLTFYAINMARNFTTKRAKFNKLFTFEYQEISCDLDFIDNEFNLYEEVEKDYLIKYINETSTNHSSQYFYHCNVVLSVINHKSVKAFSREVGIPYLSILFTIKELSKHLKKIIKQNENLLHRTAEHGRDLS